MKRIVVLLASISLAALSLCAASCSRGGPKAARLFDEYNSLIDIKNDVVGLQTDIYVQDYDTSLSGDLCVHAECVPYDGNPGHFQPSSKMQADVCAVTKNGSIITTHHSDGMAWPADLKAGCDALTLTERSRVRVSVTGIETGRYVCIVLVASAPPTGGNASPTMIGAGFRFPGQSLLKNKR